MESAWLGVEKAGVRTNFSFALAPSLTAEAKASQRVRVSFCSLIRQSTSLSINMQGMHVIEDIWRIIAFISDIPCNDRAGLAWLPCA